MPAEMIPNPPAFGASARVFNPCSSIHRPAFASRAITSRCCVIAITAPALVNLLMSRISTGWRSGQTGGASSISRAVNELAFAVTSRTKTGEPHASERSKAARVSR